MRATDTAVLRSMRPGRFAAFVIAGVLASYGIMLAHGQQDALIIEKDGAVKVTGTLAVVGEVVGKGAVPRGAILMWSGDPAKLPPGWVLCDGNNNTPDLRGRFIVGYASTPTDEMKKAGHTYNTMKDRGGIASNTIAQSDLGTHAHQVPSSAVNVAPGNLPVNQNHGSGTGDPIVIKDASKTFDNRPPYMVLAYIMYIGK